MTDALVIDTNVILEWLLNERATRVGSDTQAMMLTAHLTAPRQLWSEAHTGILKRERAGGLSASERGEAFAALDKLGIEYVDGGAADRARVLTLAVSAGLTIYDAFFLDVAIERDVSLATNDRALRRAARAEGVPLV